MKFETTELPLAAALQTLGFMPDVVKSPDNRFLFVFDKTPELDIAVSDYWANKLKVSPKLQWNNVRELKSRMTAYQTNIKGNKYE
jgi:hypothetical protein